MNTSLKVEMCWFQRRLWIEGNLSFPEVSEERRCSRCFAWGRHCEVWVRVWNTRPLGAPRETSTLLKRSTSWRHNRRWLRRNSVNRSLNIFLLLILRQHATDRDLHPNHRQDWVIIIIWCIILLYSCGCEKNIFFILIMCVSISPIQRLEHEFS